MSVTQLADTELQNRSTLTPGTKERGTRTPRGRGHQWRWPLAGVLAVQAALSLRLIWSNTAFQDEALYLWVGHMEWAHWLHQAPIQPFQTWFSGSPVLYPPIGALADSLGGLAAARLLSLVLMTVVTCFLWGTARRLVGSRAAFVASAVFATLAGTEFLGAFATYDTLALFLLTCAFWIAVRACHRPTHALRRELRRVARSCLLAGALLGLACAVKYATGLFVPLVMVLSALVAARGSGRRGGVVCLTATGTGLALTLTAGLLLGGHPYWEGIMVTTVNRAAATASPFTVLKLSYLWTGLIVILAPLGFVASRGARALDRWMLAILAAAIFLVPAEQARIETTVSLHKHVVFGAWFASMAVGYLFARLSVVDKTKGWAAVAMIPIAASTLLKTIPQDSTLYTAGWPNVAAFASTLPRLIEQHPGDYLASSDLYQVLGYYDQGRAGYSQWQSVPFLRVPGASKGLASARIAIKDFYFSLVFVPTQRGVTSADEALVTDMRVAGGYRIVADTGGLEAWAPEAGS